MIQGIFGARLTRVPGTQEHAPLVRAIDEVIGAEGEFTYAIDDTKLAICRT